MKRFTLTAVLAAMVVLLALPGFAEKPAGKVNINAASVEQLQLLPRVGPAIAKRIIDHRKSSGSFQKVEEIMLVRGVGEKTFQVLKPYLTVEGETTLTESVPSPRRGR